MKYPIWILLGLLGSLWGCATVPGPGPGRPPLPVLYLDQYQVQEEQLDRTIFTARLRVFANSRDYHWDGQTPGFLTETPLVPEAPVSLKIRGQSSAGIDKHSFALEFIQQGQATKDRKVQLLNFPKESDFVLHSPWFSVTVFPNYLAYSLSNRLGIWAPRVQFVELYGSQLTDDLETSYQGIYLLTEKIKPGKHRVALKRPKPGDPSGPFLIKVDKPSPGDEGFTTPAQIRVLFEHPKKPSPEQKSYLEGFFSQWEAALKTPGPEWKTFMDPQSFADQFLLNEALGNVDGLKYSSFFHKNPGEKLRCGPLWDVDLAMGQTWWGNGEETWTLHPGPRWEITHGWNIIKSQSHPPWWKSLLAKPEFFNLVRERWKFFQAQAMNQTTLDLLMNQALKDLGVRGAGPAKTWGHYADEVKLWPWEQRWTQRGRFPETLYFTQEGQDPLELNHLYLKTWLNSRFEWLDREETWDKLRTWAQK